MFSQRIEWILGVIALGGIILGVGRFFKKDTYET
jgi:hypothetical protein